jgi:hypothetical protein
MDSDDVVGSAIDISWVAAADMLTSARNKGDNGQGLPPDSLVTRFQNEIVEACSADVESVKIADLAATVYLIDWDQYEP